MKKILTATVCCFALNTFAVADQPQDCIVEGKIKHTMVDGLKHFVHVNFFNAKPHAKDSKCTLRGKISFNQPKGAMIDNLPDGATVKFRYQEGVPAEWRWTMISASI